MAMTTPLAILTEHRDLYLVQYGLADMLRTAAMQCIEDLGTSASEFGDAAAALGFHRQGAMNRYNEIKGDVTFLGAAQAR